METLKCSIASKVLVFFFPPAHGKRKRREEIRRKIQSIFREQSTVEYTGRKNEMAAGALIKPSQYEHYPK